MSTPNNDSPATHSWAEAAANAIRAKYMVLGAPRPQEEVTAIILKFAPPDLSAEVARLREEVERLKGELEKSDEDCTKHTDAQLTAAQAENEKLVKERDEVKAAATYLNVRRIEKERDAFSDELTSKGNLIASRIKGGRP